MLRGDLIKVTGMLFHEDNSYEMIEYFGTHYELYDVIGCSSIDMTELYDNYQIWYDGDNKFSKKEPNHNATRLLIEKGRYKYYPDIGPYGIRGKALLLRTDGDEYFINLNFTVDSFSMLS